MTTQLIEAAKLALEALEISVPYMKNAERLQKHADAIVALRAALEQSASGIKQVINLYDKPEQPAQDEPRVWIDHRIHGWPDCFVMQPDPPHTTPLYTRPQAREPLTDSLYNELLFAVGNKYSGETRHQTALRYIMQAEQGDAKAAHGIKGEA